MNDNQFVNFRISPKLKARESIKVSEPQIKKESTTKCPYCLNRIKEEDLRSKCSNCHKIIKISTRKSQIKIENNNNNDNNAHNQFTFFSKNSKNEIKEKQNSDWLGNIIDNEKEKAKIQKLEKNILNSSSNINEIENQKTNNRNQDEDDKNKNNENNKRDNCACNCSII
jgi:hypothetical protein